MHRLPMSTLFDYQVCERSGNVFQPLLHFFNRWRRWVAAFGNFGTDLRKVLVVEVIIEGFDDEGYTFVVVERQALQWSQDPIFVNCFNPNRHSFSLYDYFAGDLLDYEDGDPCAAGSSAAGG